MELFNRFTNYFIGEALNKVAGQVYEQAKVKFMFKTGVFALMLFPIIALLNLSSGKLLSSLSPVVASFAMAGMLFLVKRVKGIKLAASILLGLFVLINLSSLYFQYRLSYIPHGFWALSIALFSFYMRGIVWGLIVTTLLFVPYFIFLNTSNWIEHITFSQVFTGIDWLIVSIEIMASITFTFYMIITFLVTMSKAEKQLKEADQLKAQLLKEIHHRVKNNYAMVISLLNIQGRALNNEQISGVLQKCADRIHSMSLLHQRMYEGSNFSTVNAKEHITTLLTDLIKTYSVADNVNANIEIQENLHLKMKTMAPVGFLLNELITNSLKYAFPGEQKGVITINISELDEETFSLIYQDDGIGIQAHKRERGSTSLGMELVEIFIDQLDGTIEHSSIPGTGYNIVFKSIG